MKIGTAVRNAMIDAAVDLIDAGAGAGTITIRTGAPPTNVSDADSGTLLATLTFSDPAFGAGSTGTATASAITSDSSVDATGTAGHFRIYDSDATKLFQGTVTATGGGGDIEFNSTSFVLAGVCALSSLTMTVPIGS